MKVSVEIEIAASREAIWRAITDIENCSKMISGILDLEILDKPQQGLVGLKWKETRNMFGQDASETMWITDAVDLEYYSTRAESHGSIYASKLALSPAGENTLLTMSFSSEAQAMLAKVISACMGFLIKRSMKKELLKDLTDIKNYVEKG